MSNNSSSSGGIGFCGLLTIVFIVMKLCGVIEWSWLWVLSPLWIGTLISVVIILAVVAWVAHDDSLEFKRGADKWRF